MLLAIKWMLVSCSFWVVILDWMTGLPCVGSELIIIRKVNKRDVYHKDRFNIPRSKCTDIRQGNKCAVYGGFERSPNNPCKCLCPPLMGTMSCQTNRWKCTGNEELRLREGCGFYFPYESSRAFIKMGVPNRWQSIHGTSSGCKLNAKHSRYLACNGSWVTSPKLSRNVDVISRGFDQVARGYAYHVRVRDNSFLSGKMIKLGLNCKPFGGKPCLLLKMRGTQNCFSRKRRPHKKKFRKNKKAAKVRLSFSIAPTLSPQPPTLVDGIARRLSNVRGKSRRPIPKNRRKDESRAEKIRKDEDVTTIILILAALVLGTIIVALTINLFFCSSDQETYKDKHIFGGRQMKCSSEGKVPRARTPTKASIHSSNSTSIKKRLSLQDSFLCANKVPGSTNTSNADLIRDSTDEIEGIAQNSPATTSRTRQNIRDVEPCAKGESHPSIMDSNDTVWTKT